MEERKENEWIRNGMNKIKKMNKLEVFGGDGVGGMRDVFLSFFISGNYKPRSLLKRMESVIGGRK